MVSPFYSFLMLYTTYFTAVDEQVVFLACSWSSSFSWRLVYLFKDLSNDIQMALMLLKMVYEIPGFETT